MPLKCLVIKGLDFYSLLNNVHCASLVILLRSYAWDWSRLFWLLFLIPSGKFLSLHTIVFSLNKRFVLALTTSGKNRYKMKKKYLIYFELNFLLKMLATKDFSQNKCRFNKFVIFFVYRFVQTNFGKKFFVHEIFH